MKEQKHNIKK